MSSKPASIRVPKPREKLFANDPSALPRRINLSLWLGRAVAVFLLPALAYTAFNLKQTYDERVGYTLAFEHAARVWPALDSNPTWTLPPVYLWLNAPLLDAPGGAILWGRLVSLGVYALCLASCLLTRDSGRLAAFHVWLNPWLIAYAVRAHPLLPALAIFWFCWLLRKRGNRWAVAGLMPASNLLPFLAGTSISWGLAGERGLRGWRPALVAWLWATAGLALTWLIIGGFHSQNLRDSAYYAHWFAGKPPSWGYFFYVPLIAGPYLALLGRFDRLSALRGFVAAIVAAAYCAFFFDKTGLSAGTFATVPHTVIFAIASFQLLAVAGWARCHRGLVALLGGMMAASVLLCAVPFYWERLALYGAIGPLLIWASAADDEPFSRPWLLLAFDALSVYLGLWCIANPLD